MLLKSSFQGSAVLSAKVNFETNCPFCDPIVAITDFVYSSQCIISNDGFQMKGFRLNTEKETKLSRKKLVD